MTEKTCLLCKRSNISGSQIRLQSTNINPNLLAKKPRKRRKAKNYVELLVVRPNATSQQKATINKLTSSDLKLLAGTNLNLSELYKLKQLSKPPVSIAEEHTYNNLNIIGNIPNANLESKMEISDLNVVTPSEKFIAVEKPNLEPVELVSPKVNQELPLVEDIIEHEEGESEQVEKGSLHPAVVEEHIPDVIDPYKPSKHKAGIRNEKYLEETTARTLASYIEVCGHLRNPQRGFNALHFYRTRAKHKFISYPVKNIKIYNAVLRGFAHKGDFIKIQEVLAIMNEEHIKLNIHSYIAIFECLGRVSYKNSHLKEVRKYVKEALSKGFLFNQMMNQGSFLNDEREMVLKSLRAYDPDYTPQYDEPTVWYNNHLVNHLNDDSQKCMREIEYKNNLGLFSPEKLKECVEKQLKLEKAGYVGIKSIESRGPISDEVKRYRQTLEQHYKMWEKAALTAFLRDLSTLSAQRSVMSMEPYLRSIPVKDFVTIIVEEAKRMAQNSETYSPTVKMLYKELGGRVYAR
nr:unnamed protein product [Callosobruchus analis]